MTCDVEIFKEHLVSFLKENHPHLMGNERLLVSRSLSAVKTFNEIYGKGYDYRVAMETACLELIDGFGFSLFRFLKNFVDNDFTEIPVEKRWDFCLAILPDCQKAYDNLSFDGMEDWQARYLLEEILNLTLIKSAKKLNKSDSEMNPQKPIIDIKFEKSPSK